MDVKSLKKEKYKAVFVLKGTNPSYVNMLRRAIINRVPTMAIDEVEIVENSSALYDEMLAHRIGLIVLKTDLDSYMQKSKCKCGGKGCARCQLDITLNIKGPCTVYAEDLKSKDPQIKPVYPKTPIAKLLKGQNIKLSATAILATGKDHAKFTPGLLYFQGFPSIQIKEAKNPTEIAQQCPKGILKVSGKKIQIIDLPKCDLCKACEDFAKESVKVEGSQEDFIITLESWGQLTTKEILTTAIDSLNEQLDSLSGEIKKIK
ncbi:DNA-directed RNA polymerase subunit D [Candidatus Woesearchaeota archaeon]|nr:DNA-directed RNA polymerase subunit D [Candidatus Woesearchaeota archaeon]